MRLTVCAALLICGFAAAADAQQKEPAEVPVGVVKAERKPIEETRSFVGRVDAINRVQVRARVTGYLEEVRFTEGGSVKVGDHLYLIEQGLFDAAVKQAEADLEKAKAQKVLTAVQLQRAEDLLARASGTAVARDQAKAADDTAAASILAAEAALQTAKINFGYTDITTPIAGRIGKTNITIGNVVGADSGVLTTIVSQDPMYVSFPVSQRDFRRTTEAGRGANAKSAKVRIRFSDGTLYDQVGEVDFIDVTVDRATDTVLVRASIPNPKGDLIDGQLVQVETASGEAQEKVLIPQAALIADQGGVYVFIVEDGKAAVKRVKVGSTRGADIVVEEGLKGGELVIVEGLQRVRPGIAVRANPLPPMPGGT
jgi:membrane fusion protein (multidrug efflux system)